MFLIGFICGVLALTVLLLLCDGGEDVCDEEMCVVPSSNAQTTQSWQQTRNFLYYDGTEMPIKKEEKYE